MHQCPYCPFRGTEAEIIDHLEYLILVGVEDHLLENKKEN